MTRPSTAAAPGVASAVAAGQLRWLERVLPRRPVEYDIDWTGPLRCDLRGETAVQAACGVMHVHGRATGQPVPLGIDYASATAGVLAAQGVLAALIARSRGLRVESVRTSVAQAALLAVSQYLAAATVDDEEVADPGSAAGSPALVSADGVRFEMEVLDAYGWQAFWASLGADPDEVRQGWPPFLHRFATATCPLPAGLAAAAGRSGFPSIADAANDAGVSVLPLRHDPRHPDDDPPWTMSPLPGATPRRFEPTATAPLEGMVVVESTRRVQGPMVGHILRMLGADVVRIEPPGGDPARGVPPVAGGCSARFLALNDGKRTVELDLKSPTGRLAVHELVADADVFVHNWAPGKAAHLGLNADDLARTRPGIVYAHASGWGEALGPNPPLGTDFLVQAHSGLAAALRPPGEPPAPSLMTITDVLGGLVSALGVLAALLLRSRTGDGARVDSGLFSAAGVLPRQRRRWHDLDRPLRTADGYVALCGPEAVEHGQVAATLGIEAATGAIAAYCRSRSTGTLVELFGAAGIPATPVCTDLAALAADDRFDQALRGPGRKAGACAVPLPPWEIR
jgi:crotonobetainyl-CoA:carnitine CoA-transferase CaiB-like acyl-CoA transferase